MVFWITRGGWRCTVILRAPFLFTPQHERPARERGGVPAAQEEAQDRREGRQPRPAHLCCGAAARTQQTQLVYDVHEFSDHIACDAASNSELVVPIVVAGKVVAVFDLDSPSVGRFSQVDADGLSRLGRYIEQLNWQQLC